MPSKSLTSIVLTVIAAQLVYGLYVAIERLFLSPLSRIPGPKLAALTGWYETYFDVYLPGQYVFKIKQLHDQYGPIVRITPREVSISDCDFLDEIYSPGSGQKRDKDFEKVKALGINSSVGGAWQHDLHRKRRQPLNPYFSNAMILRHESQLYDKKTQLAGIFEKFQGRHPVNLSDAYFAFSSDVVSQYSFGHNQNTISDLSKAHLMRMNVQNVLRGVKVNLNFPMIRHLIMSLPRALGKYLAPAGAADMIRFRMAIRKNIEAVKDEKGNTNENRHPCVFRELLNNPNLPAAEKTVQRLEDEGTLLVMAGTESTAKSMTLAHYHLLANTAIMEKLRCELASAPNATLSSLLQLPYLNAIAIEANRLSFGLTGRNPRVAHRAVKYENPKTGQTYNIPAGVPMSTSTILVNANEQIFPNPWTFNPERWLGEEGQHRRKYMLSFGKGSRTCLGINLAYAELAITIAEMANWNMRLHETDDGDAKFLHDYHVANARLSSPGARAEVTGRLSPGY